jgi:septum formation protein
MSMTSPASRTVPLVILASASPRRRELLSRLAWPFTVMPADVDEQQHPGEAPLAYVVRLAQAKAAHIAPRFPDALVLGADTVVVLDQQVMGKPADAAQAQQMLTQLSGRQHTVLTGLALLQHGQRLMRLESVSTQVHFRVLSAQEITQYIATDEPFDKAGAYAIQGYAAAFVASVDGCYTNVVGLPLRRTATLLHAAGVPVTMPPAHSGKIAW